MVEQNAFPRLIQLMQKDVDKENHDMHKLLLELFYEMGRIQPLRIQDLGMFFFGKAINSDRGYDLICLQNQLKTILSNIYLV